MKAAHIHRFLLCCFCLAFAAPALAQDYTGWWWNPEEPGTGYSLQVQDIHGKDYDLAYMLFYLYSLSGRNIWYSSVMQVFGRTMGGVLVEYEPGLDEGAPFPAGEVCPITLTFNDSDSGTVNYAVGGTLFSRHIERWEHSGTQDPRGLLGWWWDEDKPGMGWFIESRNSRCFLGWFNYRPRPARDGDLPRWYTAVDSDFAQDQTLFSEPLFRYGAGQTLTGKYAAPTWIVDDPEENIEFTLAPGGIPDSIDLSYQEDSFHLTRFQIPDLFGGQTCAPEAVLLHPAPGENTAMLRPILCARVKSPCGNAMDNSSIVMKLDDVIVQHYLTNKTQDFTDIRYIPSEYLTIYQTHLVHVTVADMAGETSNFVWSFSTTHDDY